MTPDKARLAARRAYDCVKQAKGFCRYPRPTSCGSWRSESRASTKNCRVRICSVSGSRRRNFSDGAPGDRPTDLDPKHRSSRRTVGSPCDNQLVNQSSSLLPAPISASAQPQFSCGELDSWCACVFGSVMRLACRLRSRAVDGCRQSSLQRSASSARIQSMRLRVVMHLSMVVFVVLA